MSSDFIGDIFTAAIIVGLVMGEVSRHTNHGELDWHFSQNKTLKQMTLYKTNTKGRITGLNLGKWLIIRPNLIDKRLAEWSLSGVIERLIFLKDLRLRNCMFVPFELKKLIRLNSLQLMGCNITNFGNISLPSLEYLEIRNCVVRRGGNVTAKRRVIRNMLVKGFPKLEHFAVYDTSRISNDNVGKLVFKELVNNSNSCCFRYSLKSLLIARSNWDDKIDDLEIVLLRIIPQFPNLERLQVKCNRLRSVQPLMKMIEQKMELDDEDTKNGVVRVKLFCADNVPGIPAIERTKTDLKEKKAVLKLLRRFPGICNLGCHSYDPDIEYELKLNHIGKASIVNGSLARNTQTLKLWPIILDSNRNFLQDVYSTTTIKKKNRPDRRVEDATFIYRLLHDIPQLVERPTSFWCLR